MPSNISGHTLPWKNFRKVFLLGKLVSIVTTCLVVLSSTFYSGKTGWGDGPNDGPSWARQTVAGSRFKTLRKIENWVLKIDSLNFVTKWQGGPSQTLGGNLGLWTLRRPARRTVAGTTARHRLRNPSPGRISWYVLRDVFDYSCLNYKVSGLMLISLITWGLKEVTLS